MCAASLMKKEIMLPPTWVEEGDDDVEVFEDGAHEVNKSMCIIAFPIQKIAPFLLIDSASNTELQTLGVCTGWVRCSF